MDAVKKADLIEGAIGAGVEMIVSTIIAIDLQQQQDKIIKELENFSSQQKKELNQKLLEASDSSERISIMLKTIAVAKNKKSLDSAAKSKKNGIIAIMVLSTLLTIMVIVSKKS